VEGAADCRADEDVGFSSSLPPRKGRSTWRFPRFFSSTFFDLATNPEQNQFYILRKAGTEAPGTGEYNKFYPKEGSFNCAGCGAKLYEAGTKFDSGCGWPAFYAEVPGSLLRIEDTSGGMARTEIRCAKCNGHQGHVFKGVREFFFFFWKGEKS
jgi:peptide-methionine (R)-S-oxide reductase